MGRIARRVKIVLIIAILCFCIGVVTAIPQQDYTLYGTATLNGKILTAQDDAVVSLKVDGIELVSYTMGDITSTDNYVLKVPMDSDPGVTTAAQEGDTAYISINGIAINEGPQIIGAPGTIVQFGISATSASNPPSVTVLYPNSGESIPIGTQVEVSAHAIDDAAVTDVTFYYSSDGGSNWNLIGAGTRVSGTAKDGVWNRTWNTNGLSAGTNYLIKAVASDGTSTGEDQSDSAFSLTGTQPDLIILDISWSPENPKEGDNITYCVKVKNIGEASARSCTVELNRSLEGGYAAFRTPVPSLDVDETITIHFPVIETTLCGNFPLRAIADVYNDVEESNEGNNERAETMSVTCVKPDLIIQDISWSPSSPNKDDGITFTVKIKNQGSGSAGSSAVKYYIRLVAK